MNTLIKPRIGAHVIYTLNESDVREIVQARRLAGTGTAKGNDPREGDSLPGIIVADFGRTASEHAALRERTASGEWADGDEARISQQLPELDRQQAAASVNIQVWLDGNDTYWCTSREMFDPNRHGRWSRDLATDEFEDKNDPELWITDRRGHWTFADSTPRD